MAGEQEMTTARHVQSPLMNAQSPAAAPRSLWALVLTLVLGGAFIFAGAIKAWDPVKFAGSVQNFHILSWPLGVRLAFYLPWLEILCGVALIVGWLRSGALAIMSALMVIFIAASVSARMRGINVDCGCFGSVTKNLTFSWHLAIDLAMLAGLLALWFLPNRRSAA
jgi:putative oxidoreductase